LSIRFSFDLGTNSIGWAIWRTGPDRAGNFGPDAPVELLKSGVRLFRDGRNPKDGESLAVMRRVPKSARKRRDRFIKRRAALMAELVTMELMPKTEGDRKALEQLDPYALRAKALDEQVSQYELGRILFHLNQRRGFQSNRKADRKTKANDDGGKIAAASKTLAEALEKQRARSFGEFLWRRHRGAGEAPANPRHREATRIRMEGQGAKGLYEFYPTRDMLKDEFDAIWTKQAGFYPQLLDEHKYERLRNHIIFYQRDLKPPRIGKCTFEPTEERLPKALPSVEAREIYERLGHLRIISEGLKERPLHQPERDALASVLLVKEKMTFTQIRKALKLGSDVAINFEESGEKDLRGSKMMGRLVQDTHLGPKWRQMSWQERDAFVSTLLETEDEADLVERLQQTYGLSHDQAVECAGVPMTDGYSRLGKTANSAILEALRTETDKDGYVITYAEAVRRAGAKLNRPWHHSDERDGEMFSTLPYYAQVLQRHVMPGSNDPKDRDLAVRYGRIANPTVHIGLNQLRRVTNSLMQMAQRHDWTATGHPDQIVVELARELKQSKDQKDRTQKRNRENREANERRSKDFAATAQASGMPVETLDTGSNRARLKLWEEQQKAGGGIALCPFTLKPISREVVFSSDIEVEHLLPRSRTLDDSAANKVLCFRAMNRLKRGRTPYEAFGPAVDGSRHGAATWEDISAYAARLEPNKRWRFQPDAMEKFEQSGDFLARQLNETKYLSRLAKAYLGKVCDPDQVYVTPGTLTGMLRGKWGLNSLLDSNKKNRTDHRHHALDAIVIGAMTRGLINFLSKEAARAEGTEFDATLDRIPWPFETFRDAVRDSLGSITVSNKPEHGKSGALHEDTAYGLVRNPVEAAEIGNLVRRKPVTGLTISDVDAIRDRKLRSLLQEIVAPFRDAKGKLRKEFEKDFAAALVNFAQEQNLRRLRVGKSEENTVTIRDRRTGQPYKAVSPGENHHMDIVQMRDGSWKGFAATVFDVNRKDWRPEWEAKKLGGKLVMRLHKGDSVEVDDKDGVRRVKTVVRLSPSNGIIYLVGHNEGGDFQKRHADDGDDFRWDFANIAGLKERNCVAVRVDEAGQLSRRRSNAR
jgi:CRISPR-associated endonuclease Csn1